MDRGCLLSFPIKGDLSLAKSFRRITLTAISAKTYNLFLLNWIRPAFFGSFISWGKIKMVLDKIFPHLGKFRLFGIFLKVSMLRIYLSEHQVHTRPTRQGCYKHNNIITSLRSPMLILNSKYGSQIRIRFWLWMKIELRIEALLDQGTTIMLRNIWELGEFSKVQKFQSLARMLTIHLSG